MPGSAGRGGLVFDAPAALLTITVKDARSMAEIQITPIRHPAVQWDARVLAWLCLVVAETAMSLGRRILKAAAL
jgi:hypothetical protein